MRKMQSQRQRERMLLQLQQGSERGQVPLPHGTGPFEQRREEAPNGNLAGATPGARIQPLARTHDQGMLSRFRAL